LGDVGEIEGRDGLLLGEDGGLTVERPPEVGQVVEHRLGQAAGLAVLRQGGGPVTLRELPAVGSEEEWQMGVHRLGVTHRPGQQDVLRSGGQQVLTAGDMGDPVVDVVGGRGQVVGRGPVGAQDDEVVDVLGLEADPTPHQIVEDHRAVLGDGETDGALGPLLVGSADVMPGVLALGLSLLPQCFQLLGGSVVEVGGARLDQGTGHLAVAIESVGLAVGAMRPTDARALVPVEPEPEDRVEDLVLVLLGGPLQVGVVDPDDEDTAVMTGVEPVEQSGPGGPDVEDTGGRRGHAHPHAHAAATTLLARVPIPSTSTSIRSPGCTAPTPDGVPVSSTSPGRSVVNADTYSMISATPKTMSDVKPA